MEDEIPEAVRALIGSRPDRGVVERVDALEDPRGVFAGEVLPLPIEEQLADVHAQLHSMSVLA
jgi:hypothetical protein